MRGPRASAYLAARWPMVQHESDNIYEKQNRDLGLLIS